MAWTCLIGAGLFENGWAIGLKYMQGFTRLWPSVETIVAMIASFSLLARALKTIPVGTGYAVWTGIGAAGTGIIGLLFLGESRDVVRLLCLVLIVSGVAELKLAAGRQGGAAGGRTSCFFIQRGSRRLSWTR
jgi:quaternary ammonium compound-resistance protein SugE